MNQDDLKLFVMMAEALLRNEETQTLTTKCFLARIKNLEQLIVLRAKIDKLGDGEEEDSIRQQFEEAQASMIARTEILEAQLKDQLASGESIHEKQEMLLGNLKALLPPPDAK